MTNYELNIISHHKDFNGKTLKKFYMDGIDTIGAYGDETFSIVFKNNTWQKVQVILSLDGTNILTGGLATTETPGKMWVVNGYGSLTLDAFPETDHGGAAFIFTSANNSVAVHTHGDLSARGIIAAAVFVEGQPVAVLNQPRVVEHHHHYPHYYDYWTYPYYGSINWGGSQAPINLQSSSNIPLYNNGGVSYNSSFSGSSVNLCSAGQNSGDSVELNESQTYGALESLAAVGAGQHVDQQISYVAGLIKPTLSETVRVRYMWWDELVAKLRQHNVAAPHASGFPGDKKQGNINLGKTPRVGDFKKAAFPRQAEPVYTRV